MVRFALNVYARYISNYWARNVDNFLVGWRFGAQSLGFYKKAYDLFALTASQLVSPLTHVSMAALSRLSQDTVEYTRCLKRILGSMAFISMGVGATLSLIGGDVIFFLLGPAWAPSGRIFSFFGLGIGIMVLYETHGWIHLSLGRPDRWFRWGIIEFVVTGLLFIAVLRWGASGIAMAWTISYWILTLPALWYAGRPIHLPIASVIGVLWKYAAASLAGGCAVLMIFRDGYTSVPTSALDALSRIVIMTASFAGLYVGLVTILHGGFGPLTQFLRLLQEVLPRRISSKLRLSPRMQEPG
jgi:PST family polysaccharide transporter